MEGEGRRRAEIVVRLLVAHVLAYPVAFAWAVGSIPVVAIAMASSAAAPLDDHAVAHIVLLRIAWPAILSFVLVHAAGAAWAFARDPRRSRTWFLAGMAL